MAKMYNFMGRFCTLLQGKYGKRGGDMSVVEMQKLYELLKAIHDLTGMRAAVCDLGGETLAACPEEQAEAHSGHGERMPIVSSSAVVGYVLLESMTKDGAIHLDEAQLAGAAKLADVMASYIAFSELLSSADMPLDQTVLDYISKNLRADLSIQALCRRFSVSKSELYRMLREAAPEGVASYVRQKRFARACELLRGTRKAIWQIAEEVGYDNPDYFLRAFKKEVGVSAGKYRKGIEQT